MIYFNFIIIYHIISLKTLITEYFSLVTVEHITKIHCFFELRKRSEE